MADQKSKAEAFGALHQQGHPLVLTNIWDAGTASAVAAAGAPAVATGSASIAEANGYSDGEDIPFATLLIISAAMCKAVQCPVSIDIETGYADSLDSLGANIFAVIQTGAVGINIEDRLLTENELRPCEEQVRRIKTVRSAAEEKGIPLFINARTDVFLREPDERAHPQLVAEARRRGEAYARAGASGFFAPGLANPDLIKQLAAATTLPLNIMTADNPPDITAIAALGVRRISTGPYPFRRAMAALRAEAEAFQQRG
ncbi:MAG: isocitrate lyase/phosphoenolpyruvate mutase family protein [Pseudomonadota bacterium]